MPVAVTVTGQSSPRKLHSARFMLLAKRFVLFLLVYRESVGWFGGCVMKHGRLLCGGVNGRSRLACAHVDFAIELFVPNIIFVTL